MLDAAKIEYRIPKMYHRSGKNGYIINLHMLFFGVAFLWCFWHFDAFSDELYILFIRREDALPFPYHLNILNIHESATQCTWRKLGLFSYWYYNHHSINILLLLLVPLELLILLIICWCCSSVNKTTAWLLLVVFLRAFAALYLILWTTLLYWIFSYYFQVDKLFKLFAQILVLN